jgi:hypothetical protein
MDSPVPGTTVKVRVTDRAQALNPDKDDLYEADHCVGMVMSIAPEHETALVAVQMPGTVAGCLACLYADLFDVPCTAHRFVFPWDALAATDQVLPEQFDVDTLVAIVRA